MDQVIGILGGGQLGRMMVEAANRLNISTLILDSGENGPAKQLSSLSHINGSFSDPQSIKQLAEQVDILTVEIEHVDAAILAEIQSTRIGGKSAKGIKIYPSPTVIQIIQDKYRQKIHLQEHDISLPDFMPIEGPSSAQTAIDKLGLPLMLKSRTLAYDGRGNYLLESADDIPQAIEALGNGSRPLYAEKFAPFVREIAVMVVRSSDGTVKSYPAVETIQQNNICHLVHAPLRSRQAGLANRAQKLAERAVASLGEGAVGIFGVELFEMPDSTLLLNEIAPRPHNSGHYTIEACNTSQFENHLRAILGLPLGSCDLKVGAATMLNLLGTDDKIESLQKIARASLDIPGATLHLYSKGNPRPGRKMGHVTVVGSSDAQVEERIKPLLASLPKPFTRQTAVTRPGFSHPKPLVSIIMGSDSDLPVMKVASDILQRFEIPHELEVVSAHRTPLLMVEHARTAVERGIRVLIAGAGGAAHLPGMVAALTPLPIIGVPVKGSTLDGVDSLHSIVQMPRGIPVATVAINNATNAALLAIRIIGAADDKIRDAMDHYMSSMSQEVEAKRAKMAETGWQEYKI